MNVELNDSFGKLKSPFKFSAAKLLRLIYYDNIFPNI